MGALPKKFDQRTFSISHTYPDDGTSPGNGTASDVYPVSVTVVDDREGVTSSATASTSVTVNNVAPTLSNLAVVSPVSENGSTTLSGNISDPGTQDSFTMVVDWGDGSAAQTFSYAAGDTSFSETHQYLDDNPTGTPADIYKVRIVSFTDDDGTPQPAAAPYRPSTSPAARTASPCITRMDSPSSRGFRPIT